MQVEDDILDYAAHMQCDELHMRVDDKTGLRAIVAIHNTQLGAALGGCRFIEYDSSRAAQIDAIRLAQGMTYKAAISGLPLGGGKAVLMKPKNLTDRKSLFQAFGKFLEDLNGRYISAVDSGTTDEDMEVISGETSHVAHFPDPSTPTALGVFHGILAAVKFKLARNDLNGTHVAIQGLGHVGCHLAKSLVAAGAKVSVFEVNNQAIAQCANECKIEVVNSAAELFALDCDVLAPCALGAVLNDDSIPNIKAKIIAGAANNQLDDAKHGAELLQRDILYAPDFVINAGGVIYVSEMYQKSSKDTINNKVINIEKSLTEIFTRSQQQGIPTHAIALQMAQEKICAAK